MDILGHIENLKAKPEHIRKRFAFSVSLAISLVIFAGWIASYGFGSSPILAEKDGTVVESPVSSLTASVGGAWSDIKKMFTGSNKMEYDADGTGGIEIKGGSR